MAIDIDKILSESVKNCTIESPLFSFDVYNITFMVWKKFDFFLDFLETYPYALDGDVPMIFLRLGPLEFSFYSKKLYKYLYKKKYKEELDL